MANVLILMWFKEILVWTKTTLRMRVTGCSRESEHILDAAFVATQSAGRTVVLRALNALAIGGSVLVGPNRSMAHFHILTQLWA